MSPTPSPTPSNCLFMARNSGLCRAHTPPTPAQMPKQPHPRVSSCAGAAGSSWYAQALGTMAEQAGAATPEPGSLASFAFRTPQSTSHPGSHQTRPATAARQRRQRRVCHMVAAASLNRLCAARRPSSVSSE